MLFLISSVFFTKFQNKTILTLLEIKLCITICFLFSLYFCPPLSLNMRNIYSGLFLYTPAPLSLIQPVFDTIDIFKDLRVSALNSYTLTPIDLKKTPTDFEVKGQGKFLHSVSLIYTNKHFIL